MTDFDLPGEADQDTAQSQSLLAQIGGASGGGADAGGGEFDVTTATAPKKTLPLQAIAVGLVLLIAAGALFLMRRQGTRAGIDFGNIVVVLPPERNFETIENEQEILQALAQTGPRGEAPEQIEQDPFMLVKGVPDQGGSRPLGADPTKVAQERRRVEIQSALGQLHLESVILGRVPIAKISGKLVRTGDMIDELFRVDRIEGRSVFLSVDGVEYEMTMAN